MIISATYDYLCQQKIMLKSNISQTYKWSRLVLLQSTISEMFSSLTVQNKGRVNFRLAFIEFYILVIHVCAYHANVGHTKSFLFNLRIRKCFSGLFPTSIVHGKAGMRPDYHYIVQYVFA